MKYSRPKCVVARRTQTVLCTERLESRTPLAGDLMTVFDSPILGSPGEKISYEVSVTNIGDEGVETRFSHDPNELLTVTWVRRKRSPTKLSLSGLGQTDLAATTAFAVNGKDEDALAGSSVSDAGDINGDGIGDIIIGVPGYGDVDDGTFLSPGAVFVVFGSEAGFSENQMPSALVGDVFARGISIGRSISGTGDVNGDGFDDILVADRTGEAGGEVYVLFGSPEGLESDLSSLPSLRGAVIRNVEGGSRLGAVASSAGDVNADGIDDLLIAPFVGAGTAYLLFGSKSFGGVIDATALDDVEGFAITTPVGPSGIGLSANGAGDINGDGAADIVLVAPSGLYVVFGSRTSRHGGIELSQMNSSNGFMIHVTGSELPPLVVATGAQDVNGDGFGDLLIGHPRADGFRGRAYILYGSSIISDDVNERRIAELLENSERRVSEIKTTNQSARLIGHSVAGAGDINGDGFGDVLIAESGGLVHVLFGGPTGFPSHLDLSSNDANRGFTLSNPQWDIGSLQLSPAGDINADGLHDVLIGAESVSTAYHDDGQATVFLGQRWAPAGAGAIDDEVNLTAGETVTYEVSGQIPMETSGGFEINAEASLANGRPDADPANDVAALFVAIVPRGDFDRDGVVGFSDFLILSFNFGRDDDDVKRSDGDIDGDGLVAFSDFLILSANFDQLK